MGSADARSTGHGHRGHVWLGMRWLHPRHTAHLPAVLEHELAHLQRRDTGKRIAAESTFVAPPRSSGWNGRSMGTVTFRPLSVGKWRIAGWLMNRRRPASPRSSPSPYARTCPRPAFPSAGFIHE